MTELLSLKPSAPPLLTLLPLKLAPPPARGEALLRPDLQSLLAEVRLQLATLVVAPAGYGKTTLLARWAGELSRTGAAVCWVALDPGDQDPAMLLAYLVRAFQLQFPHLGDQAWRTLHSAADLQRDWPLVAGALFSDLQAELATPTFLFLDDFHTVADSPVSCQLLGYLLRAAPPALHIIVSSRRPIAIAPLPRLRAEGLLVEVSQADLSLTAAEATEILARNGVELAPAELELLLSRTEGWALSVQLAARTLARQAPEQRAAYLRTLEMDHQGIFDYLASEVMADLPPDLLDFLALAALPEQFDAPLLAEVLGRADVPDLIARTQALGLPVAALDNLADDQPQRAYRFHPLWRKLLLRHARALLDTGAWRATQRQLGRSLERRGSLEPALKHYAAAGDMAELARALREGAWPFVNSPQRDSIRRWLDLVPADQRGSDPELLHMWGWSLAVLAPAQATAAISQAAALYGDQGNFQRELRALSDLAALLFWEDRPAEFAATCVRAVRAANRVRDAWARGAALVSVVALLYSRGRYTAALRVARQAAAQPRNPFWQWLLALIVASIYTQQGIPAAALATIGEALAVPQIDRDDRLRQNLLRLQALALFQQGQTIEATELALAVHRRLSDYHGDGVVTTSATMLALLLIEQGRTEEAATYLMRMRSAANQGGAAAVLTRVQILEAYSLLRAGQPAQAAAAALDLLRQPRAESRELRADDQAPGTQLAALDLQDYWLRLLLLIVLGEGGEAERSRALGQELAAQMEARGDGLSLVVVRLYLASLAQRAGEQAARMQALQAGWEVAEAQGYGFLPFLPLATIEDAVVGALRHGLAPRVVPAILRRQLPERAATLLLGLTDDSTPATRARAAALLGDLGVAAAYASLRSLAKDRSPQVRVAAERALERLVYRPPYRLRVRTLGAFNVYRGDDEVRDRDWRSVKARQLLQLLLVERGRMLPRDRIMDMLWPGLDSEAAANNLRVTLSRLTKALEPERPEGAPTYYVVQQGETYGFNAASDHELDASDFTAAVAQGRQAERDGDGERAVASYRRAIQLYGGAFLPDSLYEDWSVVERERLGLLFNDAALHLGALLLADGYAHEAIGLAWRVLENDQAQEEAYRLLMRAHASLGERSTALRLYTRCVTSLQSELGVEPLPETVALYEAIRAG